MNNIVGENHKKISDGLSVQDFRKRLFNQGFSVSKEHIIGIIKKHKLREEGLIGVQKFYTPGGMQTGYIIHPEGGRIITLEIKKIFPKQKMEYLIESTKPKTMSLAEIKQFGLALAGMSDEIIEVKDEIKLLQNEQNMCRVSAIKNEELKKFSREIVTHRLNKKGLVYEDPSVRSSEYAYLRSYLKKEIGISRVTNLNAKEHQLVRDALMDIMEWEKVPY